MNYTATTTSKGQLTIPKSVRDKLGLIPGLKIDIYPIDNGTAFIGKLHGRSKIMKFAGDLKHLDDGRSLQEIRAKAQEQAAIEIDGRSKSQ